MPYIHGGRVAREATKVFDFKSTIEGGDIDILITAHTIEAHLGTAVLAEDPKKPIKKAKPGDVLLLTATVTTPVKQRICHVEAHTNLYRCGIPSFKRLYRNGDKLFEAMTWTCHTAMDLEKLPFLYELYILDEVVR